MEFEYIVGRYIKDFKNNVQKLPGKVFAGFPSLEVAKEHAAQEERNHLDDGFMYVFGPEGYYIEGFIDRGGVEGLDLMWYTPDAVGKVMVYDDKNDKLICLKEYLPAKDYDIFVLAAENNAKIKEVLDTFQEGTLFEVLTCKKVRCQAYFVGEIEGMIFGLDKYTLTELHVHITTISNIVTLSQRNNIVNSDEFLRCRKHFCIVKEIIKRSNV